MPMQVRRPPIAHRPVERAPAPPVRLIAGGKRPLMIQGMYGLGDNIFQRAFVRALVPRHNVYLATSWPEIYHDLPVQFVKASTSLRTQAKNIRRQHPTRWVAAPCQPQIYVRYGHEALARGSIVSSMQQCFGTPPAGWDLPAFPRMVRDKPIALVRPVTVRSEWSNPARNPLPQYIAEIADDLMRDYHVISVADLVEYQEWLDGPPPPAHEQFHHGELDVTKLLGLLQSAAVVVGGVGWIVPACIAAGVPLFCVLGGHGAHNAPEKITDPRMDLTHVSFARPDRFCLCANMRHACDKRNSRLEYQWRFFRAAQSL